MNRDLRKSFGNDATRLEQAQILALQALAFHLSEPHQIEHFFGETGLTEQTVRENAQAPEVLEAALSVLVADDALLLAFAANAGLPPEDVLQAHQYLATDGGRIAPQYST